MNVKMAVISIFSRILESAIEIVAFGTLCSIAAYSTLFVLDPSILVVEPCTCCVSIPYPY